MNEEAIQKISDEEQKTVKQISQLQNHQKILLNRRQQEERRARNHRLIERGAMLEAIFPPLIEIGNEEVRAFLIGLSRLSGALDTLENAWKSEDGGST